jgi:hypothetical protein
MEAKEPEMLTSYFCCVHLDGKIRHSITIGRKWSAMVSVYVMVHAVVSRREVALAT